MGDIVTRDAGATLPGAPQPLGAAARLALLEAQLEAAEGHLQERTAEAAAAMTADTPHGERWAAVQRARQAVWCVCRDLLPLVHRVPAGYREHPAFIDVLRAYHRLRRLCEAVLADQTNWVIDLAAVEVDPPTHRSN